MKPVSLVLLVLLMSMLPAIIWGQNDFMELGSFDTKRRLQQSDVASTEENDDGFMPPASTTEGHHTVDPETWWKEHPRSHY